MLATLSGECRCVQELLPHPILAFVAGFLDVRRPCLRRRQTLGAVGRAILFPWRLYQFITRARLILLVVAWFTWLGSVPSLFLESTYFHFFRSPRIDENTLVFHSSHTGTRRWSHGLAQRRTDCLRISAPSKTWRYALDAPVDAYIMAPKTTLH